MGAVLGCVIMLIAFPQIATIEFHLRTGLVFIPILFCDPLYAWSPPGQKRAQAFMNRLALLFSADWIDGATGIGCRRLAQARTKIRI